MLEYNGHSGNHKLSTRLNYIQDCANTEPDIVLQKVHPNAMVECKDSSTWIYRGQTLAKGEFNRQHMRRWGYEYIVTTIEKDTVDP